ncbi:hypothetical protein JB92DRAFT_449357 [Gautieria morchelliformis]|nr:hypothetical protein JB92DRAFT_449357 [Gautieria morchelliformis]
MALHRPTLGPGRSNLLALLPTPFPLLHLSLMLLLEMGLGPLPRFQQRRLRTSVLRCWSHLWRHCSHYCSSHSKHLRACLSNSPCHIQTHSRLPSSTLQQKSIPMPQQSSQPQPHMSASLSLPPSAPSLSQGSSFVPPVSLNPASVLHPLRVPILIHIATLHHCLPPGFLMSRVPR